MGTYLYIATASSSGEPFPLVIMGAGSTVSVLAFGLKQIGLLC